MPKITNLISALAKLGPKKFFQEVRSRLLDRYHEKRLNVETKVMVTRQDLGLDEDCLDYVAVGYRELYEVFNSLPDTSNHVFFDYGSGKGRAMAVAATYPFKKVMGVELSEDLVKTSRENLEKMHHRKAESFEVVHQDAREYSLPSDVNVIYFFNPFLKTILGQVMENVFSSLKKEPRPLYIIAINNVTEMDKVLDSHGGFKKLFDKNIYPTYSCALYKSQN